MDDVHKGTASAERIPDSLPKSGRLSALVSAAPRSPPLRRVDENLWRALNRVKTVNSCAMLSKQETPKPSPYVMFKQQSSSGIQAEDDALARQG